MQKLTNKSKEKTNNKGLERVKSRQILLRSLVLSLLSLLVLALLPIPKLPFIPNISSANAQYEGISYDGSTIVFNQNSTSVMSDLYGADTSNNLTLLGSTTNLLAQSKELSPSTWLVETTGANDNTADDMTLVPINSGTPVGDYYLIGNAGDVFNTIVINVTTAGAWSSATIRLEYSSSTTGTFAFQDATNYASQFTSTGIKTITFTPKTKDTTWKLASGATTNNVQAYWMRFRVTACTSPTAYPKGGQAWLSYDYDIQVQPVDSISLTLDVIVTSYTDTGTVELNGADRDGNVISETLAISSASTYTTTNKFSSLDNYGIETTGIFTFYIQQRRWGVCGQLGSAFGDTTWVLLSPIQFGDGATVVIITFETGIVLSPSGTTTPYITVTNQTTLTFGILVDSTNKIVEDGGQVYVGGTGIIIRGDSGSKVYLYGVQFSFSGASSISISALDLHGDENRIWGCLLNGVSIRGDNLNVDNSIFEGVTYPFNTISTLSPQEPSLSGTFNRITVLGGYAPFSSSSSVTSDITVSNVYARNYTKIYFSQSLTSFGDGIDFNFVNFDVDLWDFFMDAMDLATIWRKYTFDLTVTYPNGTAFSGATVTIQHYGINTGTDYTGTTDSNGEITQQTLIDGFYNQTGGNTIYDYNPYNIQITSDTMQTINMNFTLADKTVWNLPLKFNVAPEPIFKTNLLAKVNEYITLDASDSIDTDGSITSYSWNFGDGNVTSTGAINSVVHSWSSSGTYTITLTVTDNQGATNTLTQTMVVSDYTNPIARFKFSPSNPSITQSVYFDASNCITDEGVTISTYAWNFGDGSTSSESTIYHSYVGAGSYQVALTVTDSKSHTNTYTQTVTVTSPSGSGATSGPNIPTTVFPSGTSYIDVTYYFTFFPQKTTYIPVVSESSKASLYVINRGQNNQAFSFHVTIADQEGNIYWNGTLDVVLDKNESRTLEISFPNPDQDTTYFFWIQLTDPIPLEATYVGFQTRSFFNWAIIPFSISIILIIAFCSSGYALVIQYRKGKTKPRKLFESPHLEF